jgi:hypothetical protein
MFSFDTSLITFRPVAHLDLDHCILLYILDQVCAAIIDLGNRQICDIQTANGMSKSLQYASSNQRIC